MAYPARSGPIRWPVPILGLLLRGLEHALGRLGILEGEVELFVGSPAEVTNKILAAHEVFGFDRFLIQMAIGVLDHLKLMKAIELLGRAWRRRCGRQWGAGIAGAVGAAGRCRV